MHGFRDNEVSLQAGYDFIVISTLGGASGKFSRRNLKSDHDFLIVFHSNFLSAMHGFRENEVVMLTDVMVIFPLVGALGGFS